MSFFIIILLAQHTEMLSCFLNQGLNTVLKASGMQLFLSTEEFFTFLSLSLILKAILGKIRQLRRII